MPINLYFRSLQDEKEVDDLTKYLLHHDWKYSGYGDWVYKTKEQILAGDKKAIIGLMEGKIVTNIIYQQHGQFPRIRELKNMRIASCVQGRGVGTFSLKLALTENPKEFDAAILDIPEEKTLMRKIVESIGFTELAREQIYDDKRNHIIYVKEFERTPSGIFAPVKRKFAA